jgi:hypothetical protein
MTSEALAVARKKSSSLPGDAEGPRPIAIAVRGWPAWKEWADRLREFAAKRLGVPLSLNALVGLSLAHYAKAIGFKEEPPER